MRDDDFSCFIKGLLVLLILGAIVWLMTCCSLSRKVVSDRETRDSVVYTYKTLYRDSLRVKDSTIFIYQTIRRDSVVLKVDKKTGGLIACGCEISSACGYFLFIHGVEVEKKNAKGYALAFLKALAVAFARQKGGDQIGEAVEDAFNEAENKETK